MIHLVLLSWMMEYMKHTEWGQSGKVVHQVHAHERFHPTENDDCGQYQITEWQKE